MANHGGGVGSKFVSVNLNKSYGQSSHSNQSYTGAYGPAAGAGRAGGGGVGVGGGMVVLSRSRTLPKAGPKLSVPPPLNLPSLRKEHERFDLSGSGSGPAGGARPGSGQRPNSSAVGWTKPVAVASQEKNEITGDNQIEQSERGIDGLENRVSSAYLPPSRSAGVPAGVSSAVSGRTIPVPVEKAVVLRGEDFPSLQAAVPNPSSSGMKLKENVNQKVKQGMDEASAVQHSRGFQSRSVVDVRPQEQSSTMISGNGTMERGELRGLGSSYQADQSRKQDGYFPGPLPLFRLNPRYDWADDERDTGHGFADRIKDLGVSKSEDYWDRDFDFPRASILPPKPAPERWGARNEEAGRKFSADVSKLDPSRRDTRTPSREGRDGNMWRSSPIYNNGFIAQETGTDRITNSTRVNSLNKDFGKENKYVPQYTGNPSQDGGFSGNQESSFRTRNNMLDGRPQWNQAKESFNRGADPSMRDRYAKEQSNKYRVDSLQNNSLSKSYLSSGGKVANGTDSSWALSREKGLVSKSGRSYLEDPFDSFAAFDEKDPFSGSLVGVIKRKKDMIKQTDFVDPVRESFEAELERVQKMQEVERQRIIEEQERALEQARRREEERQRLIREEEERRIRLEEEAKEAAWRAEQEQLESIRRAEEQRIAREEEKRRIYIEEERTKQAARQKLLELEAKIAKRQAETEKSDLSVVTNNMDEKLPDAVKNNDVSASADTETWEDRERMAERMNASASSDQSVLSRPLVTSSRSYPNRENPSGTIDKGKTFSSWQRGMFDHGSSSSFQIQDQKSSPWSPRRDSFANERAISRKDLYGGAGYMSSRAHQGRFSQEPYADEIGNQKDQRWKFPAESDSYIQNRDMDLEFQDNFADRYGDLGWGHARFRGTSQPSYLEREYSNSDADELYSFGRSRYSVRQPRVFPPPIASTQRTTSKTSSDLPVNSEFLHSDEQYNSARSEFARQTGPYAERQDDIEQSDQVDIQREHGSGGDQELGKDTPRCDSQSSVSVSSPPNSPPHLSHDELDESGDSPISASREVKQNQLSGGSIIYNDNSSQRLEMPVSSHMSAVDDDEWTLENNDIMQQQDEYDEDGDAYEEVDEAREGDEENLEMNQDFEDLDLEEKDDTLGANHLVLGFDEGVEVEIPNDDYDRNASNQESGFTISDPVHIMGEVEEVDGFKSSSPANIVNKNENSIQGIAVDALSNSCASLTTDESAPPTKQVKSSTDMPFSNTTLSTSSAHCPVDDPVNLQFGLFTGPPLIPSPVPSIQIGSIQMPLHLHPPVTQSLAHLYPSQSQRVEFGSVFQGVLPLPSQSLSFVQPNGRSIYGFNQNPGGALSTQPTDGTSTRSVIKDEIPSLVGNNKHSFVSGMRDHPHTPALNFNSTSTLERSDNVGQTQIGSARVSSSNENKLAPRSVARAEVRSQNDMVKEHQLPSSTGTPSFQLPAVQTAGNFVCHDSNFGAMRAHGRFSGSKGKRFTYAVRNPNMKSTSLASDLPGSDANSFQRRPRRAGLQRTEFRVRENTERRQPPSSTYSNHSPLDDKLIYNGKSKMVFLKTGSKRGTVSSKMSKQMAGSESLLSGTSVIHEIDAANRVGRGIVKDGVTGVHNLPEPGEGNLKRNMREEDIDAPLQSGIVRVFKQPGIEAAGDEDDFIEVRSKRQMLNDRREQREKEIKAKSRISKPPRKPRSVRPSPVEFNYSEKASGSIGESSQNVLSDFHSSEARGLAYKETSTTLVSQPLAPIGTPAVKFETQFDKKPQMKPSQPNPLSVLSGGAPDLGPMVKFESENKDSVAMPLNYWDPVRINQQVMTLNQTQLQEAMKPPLCDKQISSVGSHTSAASEPLLLSSSALFEERSFSSSASPINSLLAGEKIQFGAVTSPTLLPPSDRAPGSSRPDINISHKPSVDEDECNIFFEKDKSTDVSYIHIQDPEAEAEAEAEAAASAVAVAAIDNDEGVGTGLGSLALSDSKSFGDADIVVVASGMRGDQNLVSLSRAEESLSVSLPADLSVDTSITLWPPLPSPQSSSGQLLSHFPGGQPSNFPFYEMNTMLGGPIFAFAPREESAGSELQPEKNSTVPSSAPLGTWQQCQSNVDSFYGPAAGFTGPFFSHPGGAPGVQGPPRMVVYNHFGPVAQFGQVGLSFMGPTYIPSSKSHDWKHNIPAPAVSISDDHLNDTNGGSTQRNPHNITPPIPHLAQGPPLMPVPPALAMFDVSSFQSQPDMSVQARWSHVPVSALHALPLSRSLQQQAEGSTSSQFVRARPNDQSINVSRFPEPRTSTTSESGPSLNLATEVNAGKFSEELGLLDSSNSTNALLPAQTTVMSQSSSVTVSGDAGKTESTWNSGGNQIEGHGGYRARAPRQKNSSSQHGNSVQQKNSSSQSHSVSYNYQRGSGTSQRNNAGNDWSNRRPTFYGRNQSFGGEKGFPSTKVKQVYVAKQTLNGTSTA